METSAFIHCHTKCTISCYNHRQKVCLSRWQPKLQTVTFYTVYKKLMYLQAVRAHLYKIPTML